MNEKPQEKPEEVEEQLQDHNFVLSEEGLLLRDTKAKRNFLLSASDWTQVADAPVDKQAWAEYRQALRDVPQQSGFPESVTWPTPPK